mmetsp:Transcript_5662/g.16236  ORF Transcript_5662/g.16236 Transcript_5662/m.16236 type:complete len:129 (+) Transcript_5662:188-574(+)|eukprot:CAMPEP_0172365808 /NCGR_PEP_ID=MMETSP1060-20121228/12247_1 /TAXON_ID=37318 /ORGANISM="Pseudo-nitzschia pungens, Strain cf. cingulata" /LENGTH=128 /DNA_ID=CAMNT_0013089367 /DNA_START=34 /DNA_END=420 /DNA_ORIENTATION=-
MRSVVFSRTSFFGVAFLVIGALLVSSGCDAFGVTDPRNVAPKGQGFLQSRQNFVAAASAAAAILVPRAAFAKDDGDYVKGSKEDPAVQAKLSVCVYECTKPKGEEQKSRTQCLKECKAQYVTARSSSS